jgi:cell division protein FtsQ
MFIAKSAVFVAFVIVTLWGAAEAVKKMSFRLMPIRHVRVQGSFKYINKVSIKNKLLPFVTTGLFAADIQAIKAETGAMPWVDNVKIKRIWPDTIGVSIYEQQPIARWGAESLLNVRGEIFKPEEIEKFSFLPGIDGPEGSEKRLSEVMHGLQLALEDQSLELREFSVSERRSWKLQLTNDMELQLGRLDQLQKFQRLMKTLPILAQTGINGFEKIKKVDMRYPNGFAVTWKPGMAAEWQDAIESEQTRNKT